jgi:HAD superfamily hydrolase (TIGR01509 family)
MKAVIFDMDGVVVDSEPGHEKAFLEVVKEIGHRDRLALQFSDYIGRSDHELWMDFVAVHKPRQTLEELLAMKRERVVEIIRRDQPIFDGLPELVERLAATYSLGLASGSETLVIEEVLALRGLRQFFKAVVSAAEVKQGKPAPDIFLRTAELLGVAPADCWVIEDSKPGIAAGLAAGMRVIAITNTHLAAELGQATYVVNSYEKIAELLLRSAKAKWQMHL